MASRELFQQPTSRRRSPLAALLSLVLHGAAVIGVLWLASMQAARPEITREPSLTFLRVSLPKPPVTSIEPLREVPPLEAPVPEPPPEPDAPALVVGLPEPPQPPEPEPPPTAPVIPEPPRRPAVRVGEFAAAPLPAPKADARQLQAVDFGAQQAVAPDVRLARVAEVGAFEAPSARDPRPCRRQFGRHHVHVVAVTAERQHSDRPAAVLPSGFESTLALSATPKSSRTVASSGFGSTSTAPQGVAARQPVKPAGFVDDLPAPAASAPRRATDQTLTPLEVLYKPAPDYSAEARALKIEGTVTLEVKFSATGEVRVLRVVRGLGHGLDEMAIHAAEQIRFKPAQSAGKPIDVTADVQIVFRLT